MAPEKPLPVESLLPFNERRVSGGHSTSQTNTMDNATTYDQSPESHEEDYQSGNETEKPKRAKRSRACISCRNMKIRCLPIEGQEACSSCAKVNRECIMPGPPRKRQKTVHKVAELEKKINALTDALLAKGQPADTTPTDSSENPQTTRSTSEPAKTDATSVDSVVPMTGRYERNFIGQAFPDATTPDYHGVSCVPSHVEALAKDPYVDVIERGDLSMEVAISMFKYWRQKMCATSPLVVFPPGTEAQDIRNRRPMLFLTIMTISSPMIQPSAQPALTVELNRQLSERVLFHGEKSLDLVQALTLNCQYYMRPRTARDLSFNQYVHAAAVMCLELGIGKRSRTERGRTPVEELELRRTWLACYQEASVVTILLRLPSLIKYSTHIDECLQYIKSSPYAQPSDKWLCALVRLQRLLEEVAVAFDMDDPAGKVNFLEAKIQYQLKSFERQLEKWKQETDVPVDKLLVEHTAACATLYIHEIAIHVEHNIDDFRPGAFPLNHCNSLDFVTSGHIEALSIILDACHKVLDIYLSLDIEFARSLPNVVVVWSTYAIVVLVKLHWMVHDPLSKFGSVFLADVKTEYYLDAMLKKLGEIAEGGHGPCAEAFGFVYKKLKMWHMHRAGRFTDDEKPSGSEDYQRRQAARILLGDPASIMESTKDEALRTINAERAKFELSNTSTPVTQAERPIPTSDLNAAYDAASYGNTNWDQFNFSVEELNMFDLYMNNASGWMGYLI